ncbi:MAG: class I SAM-dependent DNA methyltransferase [Clostridiaceae bacterium]
MNSSYENLASIYDKLITEDIDYDKISSYILKAADRNGTKKNKYLDIACGTGIVLEKLYKFFHEVRAVDYSLEMLSEAELKFRGEKNIRFISQNMVDLDLCEKFDVITCVLDAVNYILENNDIKKFFARVYDHLEDDGIFVFDINSYYKLSEVLGNNTYTYDTEELFYCWENEFEADILNMYLTFFIKEGEYYKRFQEEHIERAYKEEFIEEIIKDTGFKILSKNEDYNDGILSNTNSERIVYTLKRGEN